MKFIITILFFIITLFSGVFYVNASVASEALDSVTPEKLQGTA